MAHSKRHFHELSSDEKMLVVEAYLDGMAEIDDTQTHAKDLDWLRRHIPSHDSTQEGNYIFISYSHRDYKKIYRDLAFFRFNPDKRVRFWYDEGLPAGTNWLEAAQSSLRDPKCVGVIFYLSDAFLRSPAVWQEIEEVSRLGKPYLAISLEEGKHAAKDFLSSPADAQLLQRMDPIFPRANTALTYTDEYEDVLYRIHKIEEKFSVTENVYSDFVCEKIEDGLRLVEYKGDRKEVYIPERIGADPVVEIVADFSGITQVYIPATVLRIKPIVPPPDTYEELADINQVSLGRLMERMLGGYQSPGCILGESLSLQSIQVDPANPVYYDREGVLYSRDGTLVRCPPDHAWKDEYLDGVTAIGMSAFLGYRCHETITIPPSVTQVGDHAFAYAAFTIMDMTDAAFRSIGTAAFAGYSSPSTLDFPLILPHTLEQMGEWAFRGCTVSSVFLQGDQIQTIPRGAFFRFTGDYASIPDSVKTIEAGAFACCDGLESIIIPAKIHTIRDKAFAFCNKLYRIELPLSLTYLAPDTFEECDNLRHILYNGSMLDLMILQSDSQPLEDKALRLVICKNQRIRRLKANIYKKRRERAKKFLESEKLIL